MKYVARHVKNEIRSATIVRLRTEANILLSDIIL